MSDPTPIPPPDAAIEPTSRRLRLKLEAKASQDGAPIRMHDIRLVCMDSGRELSLQELKLVATTPYEFVTASATFPLSGLDIEGLALLSYRDEPDIPDEVRPITVTMPDGYAVGAQLATRDSGTGKLIPGSTRFDWQIPGAPHLTVDAQLISYPDCYQPEANVEAVHG